MCVCVTHMHVTPHTCKTSSTFVRFNLPKVINKVLSVKFLLVCFKKEKLTWIRYIFFPVLTLNCLFWHISDYWCVAPHIISSHLLMFASSMKTNTKHRSIYLKWKMNSKWSTMLKLGKFAWEAITFFKNRFILLLSSSELFVFQSPV